MPLHCLPIKSKLLKNPILRKTDFQQWNTYLPHPTGLHVHPVLLWTIVILLETDPLLSSSNTRTFISNLISWTLERGKWTQVETSSTWLDCLVLSVVVIIIIFLAFFSQEQCPLFGSTNTKCSTWVMCAFWRRWLYRLRQEKKKQQQLTDRLVTWASYLLVWSVFCSSLPWWAGSIQWHYYKEQTSAPCLVLPVMRAYLEAIFSMLTIRYSTV